MPSQAVQIAYLRSLGLSNAEIAKKLDLEDFRAILDESRMAIRISPSDSVTTIRNQLRQQLARLYENALNLIESPLTSDSNKIQAITSAARIIAQISVLDGANAPIKVDTSFNGNMELRGMTNAVLEDPQLRNSALDFIKRYAGSGNSESGSFNSGGPRLLSESGPMDSDELSRVHQSTVIDSTSRSVD